MRTLQFILFLILNFSGNAQPRQSFTIEGTIADSVKWIYLSPLLPKTKYNSYNSSDSCEVINHRFHFNGTLSYPHFFKLSCADASKDFSIESDLFLVQPGKQFIYIDSLTEGVSVMVQGSIANNEFLSQYQPQVKPFAVAWEQSFQNIDSVWDVYKGNVPKLIMKALREQEQRKKREVDTFLLRYVQQNPFSYVALWKLAQRFTVLGYVSIYSSIYEAFSHELKNTVTGNELGKALRLASVTGIGQKFPSISLLDIYNRPIRFSNNAKNKQLVFVDVWYSHCAPCISQFNQLKSIYDRYREAGFEIISISVDKKSDRQDWLKAISKYHLEWTQFWDVEGKECQNLAINSFPSSFLLDQEGNILLKNIDPFELDQYLDEHLRK